jgi:hypothetical protein
MSRRISVLAAAVVGVLALTVAGCGDDNSGSSEPTKVDVSVTEGKQASVTVPAEIKGGAVEFTLDNSANKQPHSAQLIKLDDGHTFEDAAAIIGSDKPQVIPEWLRAEGGVTMTRPGETGTATVDLDEGHYVLVDDAAQGEPPHAEFDVKETGSADLPDTDAKVVAATTGSDDPQYEWQVDGLKAGVNTITFESQGDKALHHVQAVPIKGDATIDQVQAELESNSNGPPQTLDPDNGVGTAILDGDKSEVTTLDLKPGRYALICFLSDRDEPNKPHFKEGLLKEVTIAG